MHHLIDEYRRHVAERGDKPKTVWCLVSTGGLQPVGYLLGWSINKREIERRAAERGGAIVSPALSPAELAQRLTALDWSQTSLQHQLAISAAVTTLRADLDRAFPITPTAPSNVTFLRAKNKWTTLHQLDGRPWASSFDFGPDGAWAWVVETVATEWEVPESSVASLEGTEGAYDGDDLVTIDGLPAYRLRHCWK